MCAFERKTDVARKPLFDWNQYANLSPKEARDKIYADVHEIASIKRKWYWISISRKRCVSFVVRLAAFGLLVVGTTLPLFAGTSDDPHRRLYCTQIGFALLGVAGMSQLADRVFGWSSGWLRYVKTVTAMESATYDFEMAWAKKLIIREEAIDREFVTALFELAEQLLKELDRLQGEETKEWITEFNSGMALLDSTIKSQREEREKQIEALKATVTEAKTKIAASQKASADALAALEKSRQPGGVNVELTIPAGQSVKILLDGAVAAEEFQGRQWSITGLAPGLHKVEFVLPKLPNANRSAAFTVESGKIASLTIRLEG